MLLSIPTAVNRGSFDVTKFRCWYICRTLNVILNIMLMYRVMIVIEGENLICAAKNFPLSVVNLLLLELV